MLDRMIGYWHTRELPEDIRRIRSSWDAFGPRNIMVYDHQSALAFIESHYGVREISAFKTCAVPAMQSDLFRVLEIYKNGGFYLDLGIELLAQPFPFLSPRAKLVLYRRWHGRIANGIFSSAPHSAILLEIGERIIWNIENRISENIWEVTEPKVWIETTSNGEVSDQIDVIDHSAIAGKMVRFHQKLSHKQEKKHWSKVQEEGSIFLDSAQ